MSSLSMTNAFLTKGNIQEVCKRRLPECVLLNTNHALRSDLKSPKKAQLLNTMTIGNTVVVL